MRDDLSQRYAAGEPKEEIRRQLCGLNVDTVLTARKTTPQRLDAVHFFDELFGACVLVAAGRGYGLRTCLPRLPYYAAADYRVLRLAVCELLSGAFSRSHAAEIALDVSKHTLSILISPAFDDSFPVAKKAAALHGGWFLSNGSAAELRIPAGSNTRQPLSGFAPGTLDYLRDCFSPVYTNIIFPEQGV